MTDTTTQNTDIQQPQQPQQPNADPAETGENKGKLFTQDEVNRIVSERLNREREKTAQAASLAEPTEADRRLAEITATENRLRCKEFLFDNKHYPPERLELYDTSDFNTFKANAEKLLRIFPHLNPVNIPKFTRSTSGLDNDVRSAIASAFKPKL